MQMAAFVSNSAVNTTFYVVADNFTVVSLIGAIDANCSTSLSANSSSYPIPYNETDPSSPKPEQAIQYYRASSVVLALDGYNNSAALSNDSSLPDTPLPTDIDTTLLDCLNQTIGVAVPLVDASGSHHVSPSFRLMGLLWVLWYLSPFIR